MVSSPARSGHVRLSGAAISMIFPALLFILDIGLWWLATDVETRFANEYATTMCILLATLFLFFAVVEFVKQIVTIEGGALEELDEE